MTPRGTPGVFRLSRFFAPLLALAGLCGARIGECSEPASVLILTPNDTSSLLDEGVVRVRGELSALGLTTETQSGTKVPAASPSAGPSYQGTLVFERFGDWLRIQAWNPNLTAPVTQWIDSSDPTVNAEVLAVRAVEALRASLLPYLRRPAEDTAPQSGSAPGTSGAPGSAPRRAPPPDGGVEPFNLVENQETDEAPVIDHARGSPVRRPRGSIWIGPGVGFDLGADIINYGAQGGFTYGSSWLLVGARLEVAQAKARETSIGRVEVRRFGVIAEGRARFAILDELDAYAALGGGVQLHRVEGIATAQGYDGYTSGHTSLAFLGEVGGVYWFSPQFALYLSARSMLSADAPVVLVDNDSIGTLNRPELAFSTGFMLGLE